MGSTATLAANTPTVGTGVWTVSGPSALTTQFSSTSAPAAVFTPAGGAGTYTLTWTISNGACTASTSTMILTVGAIPSTPTITPSSASICNGAIQNLTSLTTGLGAPTSATQGTGASTSTASSGSTALGPNPFQDYYGSTKQQMLIKATELSALGMTSNGATITNYGIYMGAVDGLALPNVTIKMQNSSATLLTTAVVSSGWTTVYYASSYTPVSGLNAIPLTTPFVWDGTSNLLVEINYADTTGTSTGLGGGNTSTYDTTSYVSTWLYRADSTSSSVINAYASPVNTAQFTYSSRSRMRFTFQNATAPTWSPTTGLYTDSGATAAYSGTALNTVYAKPTTTTTYTASVNNNGSCTVTSTSAITVKTSVAITSVTAGSSSVCSGATTTLTANGVVGDGAVVTWYSGAGGTGTNYGTGTTYVAGPGTYYARVTGDCGTAVEASITIGTKVNVAITSATSGSSPICSTATTTLTANGVVGDGAVVTWYSGTGGTGTNYGTGTTYVAGPGTYYARVTGDCGSPVEASVTVGSKVNVAITSVTAATNPICATATTTLTANGVVGDGAVITWYSGTGGTGTNYGTGTTYVAGPGTYYARVTGDCGSAVEASITVNAIGTPSWANLQWPPSGSVCLGGTFDVYGQVYEAGVTDSSGQGAGISVEFGYSSSNTDPSTWTSWSTATYNVDSGNNDE